jgi:Protein of unknown function (DUF3748)/WD40-like Beta Propeller Repeat
LVSSGKLTQKTFSEIRQITREPYGHVLTNVNVWSPDSQWIVYDVRSDAAGSVFDGTRIERINISTQQVETVYESKNGACCGVATCSQSDGRIAFIEGPEFPTDDWAYCAWHRRGLMVDPKTPGIAIAIDACDTKPPYTDGALRGGSHVHVFSPNNSMISFTYEDYVLTQLRHNPNVDWNQRNIGVSVLDRPVTVAKTHPRNHDGSAFSVLVTTTHNQPRPGSDEIQRAYEDAWIGTNGYVDREGRWQPHALAFLGDCVDSRKQIVTELFVVDLPLRLDIPGDGPLPGTPTRRPFSPKGCRQRRMTFTESKLYPGVAGPRHWPRSHPDGSQIAVVMRDGRSNPELFLVSTATSSIRQLTHLPFPVASAFTWSPDGSSIAFVANDCVMLADAQTGSVRHLTRPLKPAPRPEACVFSPDGKWIAFVQRQQIGAKEFNQISIVAV